MKIGILGGTFDPVHLGHVALGEAAIACAELDTLLVVPARTPPHKDPASAPAADRLVMCRLAFGGLERVEVSDAELRRAGKSYTVGTLAEIAAERPGADLHLVLGWDAARLLPSWHEPERVLELARLVLFPRPGVPGPGASDLAAAGIDPLRALICAERTPEIDATEVRRRAAAGQDLRGLVPDAVAEYIAERGLYRGERGDNAPID